MKPSPFISICLNALSTSLSDVAGIELAISQNSLNVMQSVKFKIMFLSNYYSHCFSIKINKSINNNINKL